MIYGILSHNATILSQTTKPLFYFSQRHKWHKSYSFYSVTLILMLGQGDFDVAIPDHDELEPQ